MSALKSGVLYVTIFGSGLEEVEYLQKKFGRIKSIPNKSKYI